MKNNVGLKVALIYNENDYQINHIFADGIINEFKNQGMTCNLITINDSSNNLIDLTPYEIIINRTRKTYFLKNIKEKYIFNNPSFVELANSKLNTYQWAKTNKLNVLKTDIFNINKINDYKLPFIIKKDNGHGGKNVHLIKKTEFLNSFDNTYVIQEYYSKGVEDIRVYVMFNKIFYVIKRSADSNEFRSNFSINKKVKKYHLSLKEKIYIKKIIKKLPPGYYGLDFFKNKKLILNEIEDVVGSKSIYSLNSKINLPKILVKNLLKNLNNIKRWSTPINI